MCTLTDVSGAAAAASRSLYESLCGFESLDASPPYNLQEVLHKLQVNRDKLAYYEDCIGMTPMQQAWIDNKTSMYRYRVERLEKIRMTLTIRAYDKAKEL